MLPYAASSGPDGAAVHLSSERAPGRRAAAKYPPIGCVRVGVSSNLITYLIAAVTMLVVALVAIGFPSLAFVVVKYFKLKEREMTLELEYRQKFHDHQLATDERVQRLEDALTSLDHDVRVRLGIGKSEAGLSSLPESSEGPAARESEPAESPSPARIRAR